MDAKKACAISWNKKRGSPFLCGGDRPARRGEPRRHGNNGRGLSMGPCIPRSTEAGRRPPEEMCSRRGPHLRALLSKWVYRRHFLVRRANESEHTTIPTGPAWRTGFDASRVFIEGGPRKHSQVAEAKRRPKHTVCSICGSRKRRGRVLESKRALKSALLGHCLAECQKRLVLTVRN